MQSLAMLLRPRETMRRRRRAELAAMRAQISQLERELEEQRDRTGNIKRYAESSRRAKEETLKLFEAKHKDARSMGTQLAEEGLAVERLRRRVEELRNEKHVGRGSGRTQLPQHRLSASASAVATAAALSHGASPHASSCPYFGGGVGTAYSQRQASAGARSSSGARMRADSGPRARAASARMVTAS
eukprot:NODE_15754_length_1032_cov_4.272928.p2 GENE.NODE_15754_length_1032_cov_4.272928~~NODE_15754_length_1032_cov_4.272928.p2  ORF type:complete len:187 (+),score=49.68 NODE_15754_length_1032_cov_4.272928:59-619(+)